MTDAPPLDALHWTEVRAHVPSVVNRVAGDGAETVDDAIDELGIEQPAVRADVDYLAQEVLERHE